MKIRKVTVGVGSELLPTDYKTRAEAQKARDALAAKRDGSSYIIVSGFLAQSRKEVK